MDVSAPADSAKNWFVNTMPSASGAIVYNVPGSEKTIIAGKSSGAHGHMLQLNYDDTYLRILRYYSGSWKSTDWEKISAGYADLAGSVAWNNVTGKPSSYIPSAHTHSWTSITDKLVAGNEFNIVNAGFNSDMWFNYVPINDRSKTATINSYYFGNGHQGLASVTASGFVKSGSSSSYVLLGDGGHQTISSLSVNYASSAGNADTVDGFHASSFYTSNNIRSDQNSIYDLRYNYGQYDEGDFHGTYVDEYPYPYGMYFSLAYGNNNTSALMFFECSTSNVLGHIAVKTRGAGDWNTTYSEWGTLAYLTDNVASATKLQTPRLLWGQSFDGTANVNGTIYINNSDSSNGAIRLNNNVNSNARISAISDQVIFNTGNSIRFGETAWDWNQWAGLKYTHSNKTIYLGIADNSIFNANSAQSGGSLRFPGISNVYATTFNGSLSGNASTATNATNADKVDGQHFNWDNNRNDHTYLWAATDYGNAYLVHRASISVNYANSAGNADSSGTSNVLLTNNTSQAADACYSENPGLRFWRFNGTGNNVGGGDGWIMSWSWNPGSVGGQIYLDDNPSKTMLIRGFDNSSKTFNSWAKILHSENWSAYCAAASHTHNYLPLSGGTLTGMLRVNALIFGYMYGTFNNRAAFMWDKPGSYYTGVGANGSTSTIQFSACNGDGTWVDYKQYWVFKGDVTASNFYSSSDIRLKNNINNISKSIRSFNWKESGQKSYGLIAQEIENEYPELVSNNDNGYKSINYTSALCVLIAKLENGLDKLKEKVKQLEDKLCKYENTL